MDGLRCSVTAEVDLSEAAVREGLLGVTECLLRLASHAQNVRDAEQRQGLDMPIARGARGVQRGAIVSDGPVTVAEASVDSAQAMLDVGGHPRVMVRADQAQRRLRMVECHTVAAGVAV